MRSLYLLPALLLVALCTASAQSWVKTFGGPRYEDAYNLYPTADGGFMTAGTQRITSNEEHFLVARFDAQGNNIWNYTYGDTGTTYTLFGSGMNLDGGLMFGGFTGQQFSGTEMAVAYSIDTAGHQRWFKGIDYSRSDHFHSMIERRESGYYLAGHTDSKDDPNGDMWLVKLDSARNVLWEKEYDNGLGEHSHWAIETRDGGALLFGHAQVGIHEKFWLVKVDSNGVKQWDSIYSSDANYHDSPYHLFETREGNYAMIGGSSSDESLQGTMWLLVVDTLGRRVVDKHFGPPSGAAFAWSGHQTTDSGYVLAGYSLNLSRGDRDMYVVRTKPDGTLQWDRTIGGVQDDDGYDVIELADAYIAVGSTFTTALQTGGGGDMLLARIDKSEVEPVIAAPLAPQLISPADRMTGLGRTPTLTWGAAASAESYTIEVSDDSLFTNPLIYSAPDGGNASVSVTTEMLADTHRYWWRVLATNQGGNSPYSETWSFVVGEVAGVNDLQSASALNLATLSPNPAHASTTLTLNLAASSRVEVRLSNAAGRTVSTVTPGTLQPGQRLVPIPTEGLANGAYICTVIATRTDGTQERRVMRLVIER